MTKWLKFINDDNDYGDIDNINDSTHKIKNYYIREADVITLA